jgi:hypothetical protein
MHYESSLSVCIRMRLSDISYWKSTLLDVKHFVLIRIFIVALTPNTHEAQIELFHCLIVMARSFCQ